MALMNYTGREAIDRGLITIVSEKNVLPLTVYLKVDNSLRNNPKYENCNVVFEAVLRTMSQRVDLGSVADLAPSLKVVFKNFMVSEGVLYTLKVVRQSDKMIAAEVDRLREKEEKPPKDETSRRKTLLPVNWAADGDNMKSRFWKVNYNGPNPVLLLAKGKFSDKAAVNQPAFQALAFPSILSEILTYTFITRFDNLPPWADDWDALAKVIGCDPRPSLREDAEGRTELSDYFDSVRDWIDDAAARFSDDCNLKRITSEFKRS